MKRIFLLVAGGRVSESLLTDTLNKLNNPYIIGIDGGLDALDKLRIIPDLAIGDFDSASAETKEKYKNSSNTILLNPMKDFTDTHTAVIKAIERGASDIIILGATGTRLDHVLGNFALLKLCVDRGINGVILDENNRIRMTNSELTIKKTEQYGKYVSCIPFTDQVTGVILKGFVYELSDATLIKAETLGVSNEIREEEGHIFIKTGSLMIMETKD